MTEHTYEVTVTWQGNTGTGTSGYQDYRRDFLVEASGKPAIECSSDPAFLGDPKKWNPEDFLVASVSACHKLWYLHLCAVNKITVLSYVDAPIGRMIDTHPTRKGHFTEIVLRPVIELSKESDKALAVRLHEEAHHECFLANSVNFPIRCEPVIV
ncbi:OsmC family protein [Pseudomonas akapageensis]|uniref:OsmC family protein n=1 Tax=Pseudomonas akapageensis TaxID=2609961 RepID=UPI001408B861|nr:OsmC family protein [Pseudomonas akapageensis]